MVRPPDDAMLAFLLGTAIGVMMLLSVVEMWIHNAMEHGWLSITLSAAAGALFFRLAHPLLNKLTGDAEGAGAHAAPAAAAELVPPARPARERQGGAGAGRGARKSKRGGPDKSGGDGAAASSASRENGSQSAQETTPLLEAEADAGSRPGSDVASATPTPAAHPPPSPGLLKKEAPPAPPADVRRLLRLGLVMALTMTLHNLPEGAAVAFSSFTSLGPLMALAIAVHNIPEGLIVAAPIYAATGSRAKALGLAALSGASEPVGALAVILAVRPWLTVDRLQRLLAGVGGLMAAVCVLELWPEAVRCRAPGRLAAGIALGAGLMAWTLWIGV